MVRSWLHHWFVVDGLRLVGRGGGMVGGGLDWLVGWNMGIIHWSWGRISRWWRMVGSRSMVRGVVEADTDTGHVTMTDDSVVTLVR